MLIIVSTPQVMRVFRGSVFRVQERKGGGLNGDPERVFDKTILTGKTQRRQSLPYLNKYLVQNRFAHSISGRQETLFTSLFLCALPPSELPSCCKIFSFLASLPRGMRSLFLRGHQKRKNILARTRIVPLQRYWDHPAMREGLRVN